MILCRLRLLGLYSSNKNSQQQQQQQQQQAQPLMGMIAMAIALPPPTVHEVRLEPDMFVTRLSFDFRIIHCEPRSAIKKQSVFKYKTSSFKYHSSRILLTVN